MADNDLFEKIDKGIKRATLNAILEHKQQGRPIHVFREGEVVKVDPEDIDLSLYEEK